jgi:D-glycero-alpha-D-manno-heptose-7-phosphate kinase
MIITKTPYRLSLFGGGTDYPAWFENNPSICISAAMANYCYLTVKKLPPFFEYNSRIIYSQIESVQTIDEINHPSAKACLQYLGIDNVSVTHDGDLPARSGIGSSSSFTVGLLHALYTMRNHTLSKDELARQTIHVEQNVIGENVGIQDQIIAAKGGIQVIKMGPGSGVYSWTSENLDIDGDYKKELESHIMLGFSGVSRHSEVQSKKKVENIKQGINHKQLKLTADLAEEALNALTKKEEMITIGNLLNIGWRLKRNLAEGVSESWIDDIYQQSITSGAFGGKLMGAGGGGFFMFLVPPDRQQKFKEEMKSIKVWVPFKFDTEGTQLVLNT